MIPEENGRESELDAWYRELKGDRIEVMIKSPELRICASGPREQVFSLVEFYEDLTERRISGDWKRPPRREPKQAEGQMAIEMPA
jgi:hypothetical protein